MINDTFTDLLCATLAAMLLWAAVVDIRTRTIANGLNLAIALMAPFFWWATGVDLWPDAAIRVGVAVAVFLLFALRLPRRRDGRRRRQARRRARLVVRARRHACS